MKTITIDGAEYSLTPVTTWIKQEIAGKTLEWGDVAPKGMTWEEAETWCVEQGGRLPTSIELLTALEQRVEGFRNGEYWSVTPYMPTRYPNSVMYVCFYSGYLSYTDKTYVYDVRCVRDVK
jgi:hypothetical protein